MVDIIKLQDVTKKFNKQDPPAVDNINLTIKKGEILTLLGPSGCGKTTTLRLIAGFEKPTAGKIELQNNVVAENDFFVPPEKRNIGMVFQDFALFPHLNVFDNVGFALKKNKANKQKIRDNIEMVGLSGLEKKKPEKLSGGQQQRVALARALVREPLVILLDEPFSNLDTHLREYMRKEVTKIIKKTGSTAVFVTHDQTEALSISDRIAVMKEGKIEQAGTPRQIYQFPHTNFTAKFVGQTNLLEGIMMEDKRHIKTSLGYLPCPHTHNTPPGEKVTISIRPEGIEPLPDNNCDTCAENEQITGKIIDSIYKGETIEVIIQTLDSEENKRELIAHLHPEKKVSIGENVNFKILETFVAVIEDRKIYLHNK